MSCCCSGSTSSEKARHDCPKCGKTCLSVSYQTLIHQVQNPENQKIKQEEAYSFCANPTCDVAYFSSSTTIFKHKVRALKAHQDAMLCYCFDMTLSHYQSALKQGTSASMKQFVIQQTKTDLCACTTRNPSGRCCLANFKLIERKYANQHNHS